jgi:hypothetical protein
LFREPARRYNTIMRRRVGSWLLVVGVAMLVAASPAGASGRPLDAAHYRARANAICSAFGRWAPPAGSAKGQLTALNRHFRQVVESLSALQAPPSLAKLRTQVVSVLHQELTFLNSELALFKAGKITPQRYEQDVNGASYPATEDALWHRIGAHACAME